MSQTLLMMNFFRRKRGRPRKLQPKTLLLKNSAQQRLQEAAALRKKQAESASREKKLTKAGKGLRQRRIDGQPKPKRLRTNYMYGTEARARLDKAMTEYKKCLARKELKKALINSLPLAA